jgi:hypothetical protein
MNMKMQVEIRMKLENQEDDRNKLREIMKK